MKATLPYKALPPGVMHLFFLLRLHLASSFFSLYLHERKRKKKQRQATKWSSEQAIVKS
jgi:hypothetical protein